MTVLISNQNSYKYRMAVLLYVALQPSGPALKLKTNVNFAVAVRAYHEDTGPLRAFSII